MKRRDVWAAAAILALPNCGSAVAADARTLRLGVLAFSDIAAEAPEGDVFVAELAKQGYVVGRNLAIERRFARKDGLDAAAAALVASRLM